MASVSPGIGCCCFGKGGLGCSFMARLCGKTCAHPQREDRDKVSKSLYVAPAPVLTEAGMKRRAPRLSAPATNAAVQDLLGSDTFRDGMGRRYRQVSSASIRRFRSFSPPSQEAGALSSVDQHGFPSQDGELIRPA